MNVELTDEDIHFITQTMLMFYESVGKYTEHGIIRYRYVARKLGIEKELKKSGAWRKARKDEREEVHREWVRIHEMIEAEK